MNNFLSPEDASAIRELTPILDIVFAKLIGESERKFYIETKKGVKRLLSIASNENLEWVKNTHLIYEYMAIVGVNVPEQVSEGFIADGAFIYRVWTWIDGEDLRTALPRMNRDEQFKIGMKCGETARKIHTLPPLYSCVESWGTRYRRRVERVLQNSRNDILTKYIKEHEGLADNRPTTFIKGDWNTGNLIISPDGKIWLIDAGEISGDPWWEFWEVGDDPYFNTGQIKGYFQGEPPEDYFRLLAYYIAIGTLEWCPDNAKRVLEWFNNMKEVLPTWYLKGI